MAYGRRYGMKVRIVRFENCYGPEGAWRGGRLTPEVGKALENDLERSPLEFGLNRVRWDGPTLLVHLKRQFGIKMKDFQTRMWMYQLGYRVKHANYIYLQAKSQEAKRFSNSL